MSIEMNRLLLEHGHEILLLVEPASLTICSANAAATRHLGYSHDDDDFSEEDDGCHNGISFEYQGHP